MNYRIQLVVGDGALFFLEEWRPGGVEITPEVVGLFDVPVHARAQDAFAATLDDYGLVRGYLKLVDMLRVGFDPAWRWQGVQWPKEVQAAASAEASSRAARLLADPAYRTDGQHQKTILQLMQAASRRLGTPALLEGEVTRPSGRRERVFVYRGGVVAYDRTPHPLDFLERVAEIVHARVVTDAADGDWPAAKR